MAKAATFSTSSSGQEPPAREIEVELIPPDGRGGPRRAKAAGPGAAPGEVPGTSLSRLVAFILDDLFRVPGTNLRFGLDPIIGLLPGVGDIASGTAAALILISAAASGVPRLILAKMCLNLILNAVIGAIPGVGDAFSFWFKSNTLNHALLLKHAGRQAKVTRGDWIFVGVLLGFVALTVFLVIFVLVGLMNSSARYWFGS